MFTVNIITDNLHYDDILRQLPANGINGYKFLHNVEGDCDAAIVFEYAKKDLKLNCPPANLWLWSMEPPDEEWEWIRKCFKYYSRIISIDFKLNHPKIVHHQLAIPWQINRSFDELIKADYTKIKTKDLSFVTSNYAARAGHRRRLEFIKNIQSSIVFDLWGRGFKEIEDKAEGLTPYKYAIVVENSSYKDYWSEKIADAFLCDCLPIYFGCKNLNEYFDENSFIRIDINKPKEAIDIIKEAINNNEWEKRLDVIKRMKYRILNEYQFFPVFIKLFNKYGVRNGIKKEMIIPQLSHHPSTIKPFSLKRNYYLLKKLIFKKRYLNPDSPYFGFTTYK